MAAMTMKWCKTLYSKQPFPDNYVDESFLEQLRMNVNVRDHEYGQMVRSMAGVAQQISTTLIFHSLFEGTRNSHISVALLGYIDAILPTFACIIFRAYFQVPPDLADVIGNSVLFVSTLSILSPVLGTLTQTYADDTIRALGILFGLIHLLSHNYTYIDSGIGSFSGTISMNAAMFTAVLQASRLQSNVHVFAFLLLAIELFALLPILQRQIKKESETIYMAVTALFFSISATLTWQFLSPAMCVSSSILVLFLVFISPLWFLHAQEQKNEILGPWDITHVEPEQ